MNTKSVNCVQGGNNIHKIIIIGANGVGKTSLITTFIGMENEKRDAKRSHNGDKKSITSDSYPANICLSFASPSSDFRIVRIETQVLHSCFLDEKLFGNVKDIIKSFDGCLCVFDLANKNSFDACTKLRDYILKFKVR